MDDGARHITYRTPPGWILFAYSLGATLVLAAVLAVIVVVRSGVTSGVLIALQYMGITWAITLPVSFVSAGLAGVMALVSLRLVRKYSHRPASYAFAIALGLLVGSAPAILFLNAVFGGAVEDLPQILSTSAIIFGLAGGLLAGWYVRRSALSGLA